METWFEVRDSAEWHSQEPMRRVADGEPGVQQDREFALRFAMHNDSDRKVKARVNVTMPTRCLPRMLDPTRDYALSLPTADAEPRRWVVAYRTIYAGDVSVVDMAVTVLDLDEPVEIEFEGNVSCRAGDIREVARVLVTPVVA